MSRPLRIEFAGAFYHVSSRGDRREAIYECDEDRKAFLEIFGEVVEGFRWHCHTYCLMTNHYHLFVETPARPTYPRGCANSTVSTRNGRTESTGALAIFFKDVTKGFSSIRMRICRN